MELLLLEETCLIGSDEIQGLPNSLLTSMRHFMGLCSRINTGMLWIEELHLAILNLHKSLYITRGMQLESVFAHGFLFVQSLAMS